MKTKYSIKDACKIAIERNGLCLSDRYINCNTSLLWKCAKGHEWMAPFHRIKNARKWCLHCSKNKSYTLNDAKRVANNKNGFQKIILIVYYHYGGDALKDMNGIQHLKT